MAALALALAAVSAADAQQLVVSPAPEALGVTVYRNPERQSGDAINLSWLGGYALVTETRTVQLPAGDSEIRFEGVAGNILPTSVIIRGLPAMPREKNYDARLLSAGSLVEASLGRQVHIRRTDRATGKVTEDEAIIRSGPYGIVLQTAAGFEALRCTGLSETFVYREVPPGLSAKPTLAIRTSAPAAATATLSLSYLAGQFDWQANYVARLGKDGKTLDLFAWLTLANSNDESFPAANVNAIAGQPNRDQDGSESPGVHAPGISLRCWPSGRTSDGSYPTPPPPPPSAERDGGDYGEIVVTGSRVPEALQAMAAPVTAISAEQEELGDLKLYRIPEPVTVAANAQKQVALLHKEKVRVERLYSVVANTGIEQAEPVSASIMLRARNSKDKGLGLPLPAGSVALFEEAGGQSLLAGETTIGDLAIDEDVELTFGTSSDVRYTQRILSRLPKNEDESLERARMEIELSNATSERARVEVGLPLHGTRRIERPSAKLKLVKGRRTWVADVPPNGRARLTYTLVNPLPIEAKVRESED
jgi:hypothetical protein